MFAYRSETPKNRTFLSLLVTVAAVYTVLFAGSNQSDAVTDGFSLIETDYNGSVSGGGIFWGNNTLILDGNGSDGGRMDTIANLPKNTPFALPDSGYSKTGYAFIGWNSEKDGSGMSFDDGAWVRFTGSGKTETLYAQWTPIVYTVVFDGNGSVSGTAVSQSLKFDEETVPGSGMFGNPGYRLTHWNTEADGTGTDYRADIPVKNLTSENGKTITLYAQWSPVYHIGYVLDGGTNAGEATDSFVPTESAVLPEPRKTGYVFDGWYTEKSFENRMTEIPAGTSSDVLLYAKWVAVRYTVVCDFNDSVSDVSEPREMSYDAEIVLNDAGFEKTGYKLVRWNTERDGSGTDCFPNVPVKNLTAEDGAEITLYAIWVPIKYTVNFDCNYPSSDSVLSVTREYDTADILGTVFGRTGYIFTAWNTERDGSGTGYPPDAPGLNLTTADGDSVTLYARWIPVTYRVVFDGNGHSFGTTEPQSMTYGEDAGLHANGFTNLGFGFICWNTEKDGSGTDYFPNVPVKNLTAEDGAEITLYAQWIKYYFVKFQPYGGHISNGSPILSFTPLDTVGLPTPVRDGYVFDGWYTEETFENRIGEIPVGTESNIDLYAKWIAVTYTVVFDGNGSVSGTTGPQNITYDAGTPLNANGFEKTGYRFMGWCTEPDGGSVDYRDCEEVLNLASGEEDTVNLYAVWSLLYFITYDTDNGTNPDGTIGSFVSSDTVGLPTPVRDGYVFDGWYTEKTFENKIETIRAGTVCDVRVFAKWSIEPREENGNVSVDGSEAIGEIAKDGYGFSSSEGWSIDVPAGALGSALEGATRITVGVDNAEIAGKNVISLNIDIDGKPYADRFDGLLTVTVPYVVPAQIDTDLGLIVFCVDGNGKRTENAVYEARYCNGNLTFSVPHFSYWELSNVEVEFGDGGRFSDEVVIVSLVATAIIAAIIILSYSRKKH